MSNVFFVHCFQEIPVDVAAERLSKLTKVELKLAVTDALVEELTPIQTRLHQIEKSKIVHTALTAGSRIANDLATQKLRTIMEAVGCPSYL